MMIISKKSWQIAKRLSAAQLQKADNSDEYFNETDLFSLNIGKRGHGFFLGFYSKEGIRLALEKYGVVDTFKKLGFKNLIYRIDTDDPFVHRLTIYDKLDRPECMLIECVLKKAHINIEMPFNTNLKAKSYETLAIEWLSMQNPKATFTDEKPKLPGQNYPGLGIASQAVELLMLMAWRLGLAGLVNTPEHYHNAYLYSRLFYYINPDDQAKLLAMNRLLKKYSLEKIAWAIECNAVREVNSGETETWFAAQQLIPLNPDLKKAYDSWTYRRYAKRKSRKYKYELEIDKYNQVKDRGGSCEDKSHSTA